MTAPTSLMPLTPVSAPETSGGFAASVLAACGLWQSVQVTCRVGGLIGSSFGLCDLPLSVTGCTLIFWKSAATFFDDKSPLWQTRQFCSGASKRIRNCFDAARCGVWQLSHASSETVCVGLTGVVALNCEAIFAVRTFGDIACAEVGHVGLLWQAMQSAEAVLSMTRKFPNWSSCGSWHEVHCICLS